MLFSPIIILNTMSKVLDRIALVGMSLGYAWFFTFSSNIAVFWKYTSYQAYDIVWLYYVFAVMGINSIGKLSVDGIFELAFVLQALICPIYWLLIHFQATLTSGLSTS